MSNLATTFNIYMDMKNIGEMQLNENIKICEKNIEACKEALENIKKHLYQEEHFLIMYKNRLKGMSE